MLYSEVRVKCCAHEAKHVRQAATGGCLFLLLGIAGLAILWSLTEDQLRPPAPPCPPPPPPLEVMLAGIGGRYDEAGGRCKSDGDPYDECRQTARGVVTASWPPASLRKMRNQTCSGRAVTRSGDYPAMLSHGHARAFEGRGFCDGHLFASVDAALVSIPKNAGSTLVRCNPRKSLVRDC